MTEGAWLAFWPQSSDALDYLDTGRQCAEAGVCYDTLRPVVSVLWFSLPFRLGLPPETLLLMHGVLLLLAAWVWAGVLLRLACRSGVRQRGLCAVLLLSTTVPFLLPTFFHPLTDTPAALLVILATGWVLQAESLTGKSAALRYALAGLLLGLAAGFRVFYLYPVLFQIAVVVGLTGMWRQHRRPLRYLLLLAVLPMVIQMRATHLYSQEWSYLPSEGTRYWRNTHQHSPVIGYDTLLPEESYPWRGSPACQGLLPALRRQNWRGLACTLGGRLSFLMGSYSSRTYIQSGRLEWDYLKVDPRLIAEDLHGHSWPYERTQGGARLQLPAANEAPWQILQEVMVESPGPVTMSLTARDVSPAPDAVPRWLMFSVRDVDGRILQRAWLELDNVLRRHHAHFKLEQPGRYAMVLGSSAERTAPDRIEAGDFTVQSGEYEEAYPMAPERIRHWSYLWLTAQLVLVAGLLFVWCRKGLRQQPLAAVWVLLPCLILGQSLLIIPEQRFVLVTEIALWSGLLVWLAHLIGKTRYHEGLRR
jgi:hypothetical protein